MGPTGVDESESESESESPLVSAGELSLSVPVGEEPVVDSGDSIDDSDVVVELELEEVSVGLKNMVYVVDTLSQVWMV